MNSSFIFLLYDIYIFLVVILIYCTLLFLNAFIVYFSFYAFKYLFAIFFFFFFLVIVKVFIVYKTKIIYFFKLTNISSNALVIEFYKTYVDFFSI